MDKPSDAYYVYTRMFHFVNRALNLAGTACCLFFLTQAPGYSESFLLIPAPSPDGENDRSFNKTIVDGIAVAPPKNDKKAPSPSIPNKDVPSAGKGIVEMRGYATELSPSAVDVGSVLTPRTMPRASVESAIQGQSRSLLGFYAIGSGGEWRKVRFSSELKTPDGHIEEREALMRVPSDNQIRIHPLFFGLDISPATPSGKYSILLRLVDIDSGHHDFAEAFFINSASGRGDVKAETDRGQWKGVDTTKTSHGDFSVQGGPMTGGKVTGGNEFDQTPLRTEKRTEPSTFQTKGSPVESPRTSGDFTAKGVGTTQNNNAEYEFSHGGVDTSNQNKSEFKTDGGGVIDGGKEPPPSFKPAKTPNKTPKSKARAATDKR